MVDCVEYGIYLNYGGRFIRDPTLRTEEDVNSGDEYIDIPWLTDNEDEEWQAARTQYKDSVKFYRDDADIDRALFDPTEAFVDDGLSDSIDSNDEVSFVTTSDDSEAEEARRRRSLHKVFDDSIVNPEFEVGMIFLSRKQFKDTVLAHSIYVKRETILKKNDKKRVRAVCADKRPILGLDGAFLKGSCKGQLLSAVGRDANNQMYPIAWAIVVGESTSTWTWFLEFLNHNLKIGDGEYYTFVLDQQKNLFPKARHRRCAWHIYANFRKEHKGKALQRWFWITTKSTNEGEFKRNLEELNKSKPAAKDYVMKLDPKFWCKAFFDTYATCDVVHNNMTKAFNGFILDARHKGPLSLLEDLRRKCSRRNIEKLEFAEKKFKVDFGPKIWEKIEDHRDKMSRCHIKSQARWHYEVQEQPYSFLVNLRDQTCSCRVWQLNGIPCRHGMLVIQHRHENYEDYMHPCYRKQAYIDTYKHEIIPIDGMQLWADSGMPEVDPPIPKNTPGRPKKKRHLEEWKKN
ncbi:hypothetical protein SLEP1_g20223 [Rubroshorea leprosula]|uniref:SWIM-type domain-containing protein n=1 Tax=Rubroshorea leprosula TaxID=152421 RepID=A0AAV5J7E0_9ROSI|nr:hypothetical protein SLEP1_g20223 [Rubroshorea leprosula]